MNCHAEFAAAAVRSALQFILSLILSLLHDTAHIIAADIIARIIVHTMVLLILSLLHDTRSALAVGVSASPPSAESLPFQCYRRLRKKHTSGDEDVWEDKLSGHRIRGWRAVSAAGLQGKGLPERSVFSQTPAAILLSSRLPCHYVVVSAWAEASLAILKCEGMIIIMMIIIMIIKIIMIIMIILIITKILIQPSGTKVGFLSVHFDITTMSNR